MVIVLLDQFDQIPLVFASSFILAFCAMSHALETFILQSELYNFPIHVPLFTTNTHTIKLQWRRVQSIPPDTAEKHGSCEYPYRDPLLGCQPLLLHSIRPIHHPFCLSGRSFHTSPHPTPKPPHHSLRRTRTSLLRLGQKRSLQIQHCGWNLGTMLPCKSRDLSEPLELLRVRK